MKSTGTPGNGERPRRKRLRRSDPSRPGITRSRNGQGFQYVGLDGEPIADTGVLERIAALTIPPAWQDVWICPHDNGHIQAIGTDAAGRRQYVYHQRWRERRDEAKFDRMLEFAAVLPEVRRRAHAALMLPGLPRERVLACAVRLLDRGFFRVGGESYADEHSTFGLATMRKEHVTLGDDGEIVFEYTGKSGKEHLQAVVDHDAYDVVRLLKRRRGGGEELLAYCRPDRTWRDVRSDDINEYLKSLAGREYSAKDFRTWHATVLMAVALAVSVPARRSQASARRAVSRGVQEVAAYLGNTPAVCRGSYIDPRVIDRYLDGQTIIGVVDTLGDPLGLESREAIEAAVIALTERRPPPPPKPLKRLLERA